MKHVMLKKSYVQEALSQKHFPKSHRNILWEVIASYFKMSWDILPGNL